MNNKVLSFSLLIFFLLTLSGCGLLESVFRLGVMSALIFVIIIVAILVLIFRSVSYKPVEEPVRKNR